MPTAITLKQLHTIVQAAMEWEDAHLWEFTIGREPIGGSRAARLILQDLLRPRVTRLLYTYDMGDCWGHQLTLTQPRRADPALTYPRYITGDNPAPPEDCGRIPGLRPTRSARRTEPSRSRSGLATCPNHFDE